VHFDALSTGDEMNNKGSGIIFQHQVKPGAVNDSYGLQVAALAGVPSHVIENAQLKLNQLENLQSGEIKPVSTTVARSKTDVPDSVIREVTRTLANIELDEITPKQAHSLLYKLKSKLDK
jgi:DNA mismatch repair protein MutS